jgi:NRAMP (natural resistance-associated macrophage protein)-like metal ion transporter
MRVRSTRQGPAAISDNVDDMEQYEPPAGLLRRFWQALGPGLITGAADDDPSGIATYSQAGAQFGYALAWTMFLTLPFMVAIQIISACIGWQTGSGLARNIKRELSPLVLYALVLLLVVANTINIAADLAAMGEVLRLAIGGSALLYALLFGVTCLVAEVVVPYHRYAGYLKLLTSVLLVYVAAAFSLRIPWGSVLGALLIPRVSLDHQLLLVIVAIFGTTISPYLFFWQASQEAEESRLSHRGRHSSSALSHADFFSRISFDTWIGMAFSNLIAFFIIVTTAATLHASGITKIETASQAAEALRPIAGDLTFALFAAGIIGTGLLAVPVLAGSAAYAVADAFGVRGSLELPAGRALGFYAIVGAATLAGAGLSLSNIDPVAMLFWTAVINGIVAVPIMAAMMVLSSSARAKLSLDLPRWVTLLGWAAAGLMALAVGLLAWSSWS